MKTLLSKLIFSVLLFLLVSFERSLAAPSQELDSILYSSWDGLCSISDAPQSLPYCLKLPYKNAEWQPHGNQIVAESPDGLLLLNRRGRVIRKLVSGDGIRPRWTPDGRYIYAIKYDQGSFLERWDSTGKTKLAIPVHIPRDFKLPASGKPPLQSFQMISFSPSGAKVALLSMDFKELLIADVGNSSISVLTIMPAGFSYVSSSVWLDEEHLLFVGQKGSERADLWELDVRSGTTKQNRIPGLWLRDFVTLAPDRRTVVVTATKDTKPPSWNLWMYTLGGATAIQLTRDQGAEDCEPSWRQ